MHCIVLLETRVSIQHLPAQLSLPSLHGGVTLGSAGGAAGVNDQCSVIQRKRRQLASTRFITVCADQIKLSAEFVSDGGEQRSSLFRTKS